MEIRLLMFTKLGSNVITFLEKFSEMLERIMHTLPSYHEHIHRLRNIIPPSSESRLRKALSYVYADIIQFCQQACIIFSGKGGRRMFSNTQLSEHSYGFSIVETKHRGPQV
jgi:hypothetical protein